MESSSKRPREDDGSNGICTLDTEEIKALVIKREEARRAKEWETADATREELKSQGVEINDNDRLWTTPDGRLGLLVNPAFGSSGLREEQIQSLLTTREKARASKDWTKADMIREALRPLGVEVNDNDHSWKTQDGRRGVLPRWGTPGNTAGNSAVANGMNWMPTPTVGMTPGMGMPAMGTGMLISDVEIHVLLHHREKARMSQDYKTADVLRDILSKHSVDINDKDGYWQTGDGRAGVISAGSMAGMAYQAQAAAAWTQASPIPSPRHSAPMPPSVMAGSGGTAGIQDLINQRQAARASKDWGTADKLRESLRAMGVKLHDDEKRWTGPDGAQGVYLH